MEFVFWSRDGAAVRRLRYLLDGCSLSSCHFISLSLFMEKRGSPKGA